MLFILQRFFTGEGHCEGTSHTFPSIAKANSVEWSFTVPAKEGYSRVATIVHQISGSGSNSVIVNVHGIFPSRTISVHAPAVVATNITVTLLMLYVRDGVI